MNGEIRGLSLDEWFLALQLKKIKDGLHLPFHLKVDITSFAEKYTKDNKRPPFTALLIKASSILIKENPEYSKILFNTVFGKKVIIPNYNSVNVPIKLNHPDKNIISATSVQNAYSKTLAEINDELKKEKSRSLQSLPVNKLIHGTGNKFLRKVQLRIIFFIFSNFPSFYLKNFGGGISVSSLFSTNKEHYDIHVHAYGMTTFTLCSSSTTQEGHKTYMNLGFSFNHIVTHGIEGANAASKLAKILSQQ